jgi:hypothetical protein
MNDILKRGEARYRQGDKTQILYCLNYCIMNNLPVPAWLARAFGDALHAVHTYKVKSHDDVFGRPLKKGQQLATQHHRMKIAASVFDRVRELNKAGEPIGKELFASVGKEFGIGSTAVSELYKEVGKEIVEDFRED